MRLLSILILVPALLGCGSSVPPDLKDSDPTVRIPAIHKSVRNRNQADEGRMVKDLNSEDPAVRFYAIEGLYRLTGQTLGYRYYDNEAQRQMAIRKWEQWLATRRSANSSAK